VQVYNQKSKFKEIPKVFLNLLQKWFLSIPNENSPLFEGGVYLNFKNGLIE
jgi:hypothetical protein